MRSASGGSGSFGKLAGSNPNGRSGSFGMLAGSNPNGRSGSFGKLAGSNPNGRSLILLRTEAHTKYTIIIIIDRFYIALFSALEQTHCARM